MLCASLLHRRPALSLPPSSPSGLPPPSSEGGKTCGGRGTKGIAQPTWLPLTRELSPQATEGENLQPVCSAHPCLLHQFLFYFQINFFANSAKPPIYFCIADPHYIYFHFFQIGCPNSVFLFLLRSIMFSSVQFNGKTCFCAVEIHDIIANGFLPLKTDRVIS